MSLPLEIAIATSYIDGDLDLVVTLTAVLRSDTIYIQSDPVSQHIAASTLIRLQRSSSDSAAMRYLMGPIISRSQSTVPTL